MEWYWWIAILVAAGIAGLVLLQTLIGRAITITDAARLYLSAELKKLGIRHLFPNALVIELADQCSATAEGLAKMKGVGQMTPKSDMIEYVDSQVMCIGMWLRGEEARKEPEAFR